MGQGAGAAGDAIRQEDINARRKKTMRSGSLANYRIDTDYYDQTGIMNYDTNDPSYTQQKPHSEFDSPSNSSTLIHRGLSNESGENNCFLNVTIQALWHLGPFRIELLKLISNNEIDRKYKCETKDDPFKLSSHTDKDGGLLRALCNIFVQYEFTELPTLPPTELRTVLSTLFDEFQLGEIADATETLGAILERIHMECTPSCPYGANKCLSHTVFGCQLMEQSTCMDCGASSEPILRSDFVHNVCAAELIALGELEKKIEKFNNTKSNKYQFGNLLHECMHVNTRSCPSLNDSDETKDENKAATMLPDTSDWKCNGQAQVKLYTLEPSLSLAISVGWTTPTESKETLSSFLSLMSYTINLSDLFDMHDSPSEKSQKKSNLSSDYKSNKSVDIGKEGTNKKYSPKYVFRGFVCYYGLHYVSIFQEHSLGGDVSFLLFDDTRIRRLGGWNDVKSECLRSLYQPVLLLYELEVKDNIKESQTKDDNYINENKDAHSTIHIADEFENSSYDNYKIHKHIKEELKDYDFINDEYYANTDDRDCNSSVSNSNIYHAKTHDEKTIKNRVYDDDKDDIRLKDIILNEYKDNHRHTKNECCVDIDDFNCQFSTSSNSHHDTKNPDNETYHTNKNTYIPSKINLTKSSIENISNSYIHDSNIQNPNNPDSIIMNKHPPPISMFERRPTVYEVVLSYATGQRYSCI